MTKANPARLISGIVIALVIVAVFSFTTIGLTGPAVSSKAHPDVIHIDGLAAFGDLEKPAVPFRHDAHVEAVGKEGKDCSACHLEDQDKKRSLKFKRLTDESRDRVMDNYHLNCIACHDETLSAKKKAGPVTCGECHTGEAKVTSSRVIPDFDKSLHFRHVKAAGDKCDSCHHEYDEAAKKTVYVEGQESSCVYCHKDQKVGETRSMKTAAHTDCISCHEEKLAQKEKAGPINCAGCHDSETLQKMEVVEDIPRLKRGQPEATFVSLGQDQEGKPITGQTRMKLVPFDHQAHEGYNDSCITCHHESLAKCSECHTQRGAKEGDFINLERAMHSLGNDQSCLGCHAKEQTKAECAGCHARPKEAFESKESCDLCHQGPQEIQGDKAQMAAAATDLLKGARTELSLYPDEDIPETVIIKALADEYKPASMPHRKIVKDLAAKIVDSKMGAVFHPDPGTLCMGCHHNSPATKKPPTCASCHSQPFDRKKMSRPGLKAAYHQQCMNCHQEMRLAKPAATACAECHKEKN
jgi:hypothetical protein